MPMVPCQEQVEMDRDQNLGILSPRPVLSLPGSPGLCLTLVAGLTVTD